MPRKYEVELFSFDELSPKAKKRAIEDFRNDPELTWDQDDSERLTEMFEQDLKDHYGLGDMKVGWGLSYTQGDGVCFKGSVTIPEFLEKEKEEKRFPRILKLSEEGNISVKITHDNRYCHWNSMDIEIEDFSRDDEFIPKDLRGKWYDWNREVDAIMDRWRAEVARIHYQNNAPIREWEEAVKKFQQVMKRGPREWTPRAPGPMPDQLNYPIPPEPVIPKPDWVQNVKKGMQEERRLTDIEIEGFRSWLDERTQEISREMEKSGYEEIEYHSSDDYITERLESLDWEFLKTGERWDR